MNTQRREESVAVDYAPSMDCNCTAHYVFSQSPHRDLSKYFRILNAKKIAQLSCTNNSKTSYTSLVSEAVRLLGPPARFQPSKLEVVLMGDLINNKYAAITPRTYILSHCDFTADLTLTISSVINLEQLKGWYEKDDVVAEWKQRNGELCLHVHCYVGGSNLLSDLAAEFRYHIFSKEMPLVLKALIHGDGVLVEEHPEIMDALVWVYFHSSSPKYNRMECWGPLKDAAEGQEDQVRGLLAAKKDNCASSGRRESSRSILHTLFTFLL